MSARHASVPISPGLAELEQDLPLLLTWADLARLIHRHPKSLYRDRRGLGIPPGIRVGRRVFWPRGDVLRWLDARKEACS